MDRARATHADSVVELKAERVDELGRQSTLWVAMARARDDRERLAALIAALPDDQSVRGVPALAGEPSAELRDLADRRLVEMWSLA